MINKTYVIADIHGRFDLLQQALALTGPGTVIFLGDYIDRGPQSAQVIDTLIAGPQRDDQSWVCLMGNHEQMMLMVNDKQLDPQQWIRNGGDKTVESYRDAGHFAEHILWMSGLGWTVRDNHRAYVHAMLPAKYVWGDPLSEATIWGRVTDDVGAGGLHMVHGHTPAPKLELLKNRTNLDGGAVFTGRLAVGVFDDDLPGGPVEILWAEGPKS